MSRLGTASAAAVQQYLRIARDRGLDWARALANAGVQESEIAEGHQRIRGEQFQQILATLIAEARDPLLGLHSSAYVQPGSYTILGYIVMNCATVGEALARIAPFEKLVGDMGMTRIRREEGHTVVSWQCAYPNPEVRPHMIANVLASWVNYARWLANREDAGPRGVRVEFTAPNLAVEQAFARLFRAPVVFGAPESALLIDDALLALPLRQPDPILRRTLEDHASTQMASLDAGEPAFTDRVREVIRQLLAQGISRQDSVAETLGLTGRTLQRRLGEEGRSYQMLLDEIRLEQARQRLLATDDPVADIALHLGYAEPRSFHRAFKQWTGMTPGDFRQCRGVPPPES